MPKIHLPLNDIGGENSFFEHRDNILNVFKEEPALILDGYSPAAQFNYLWSHLDIYSYIRGEKHGSGMKYFIAVAPKSEEGEFEATTLYIHPDFYGAAKPIVAAGFLEYSIKFSTGEQEIVSYTHRSSKAFARIFKVFGAKSYGFSHKEGDRTIEKYTMTFGLKYRETYEEIISTCQGGMKEKK